MQRRLVVALAVAVMAMAVPARADEPRVAPAARPEVRWNEDWPRVSVFEIMLSAAVTARNSDLGTLLDGPDEATVDFRVPLLDPGGRNLFRARSASGRAGAKRLSDIGFRTLVLAPYLVDVGFGALALHRNADVAAQLALIDFEVLTLAGMTSCSSHETSAASVPGRRARKADARGTSTGASTAAMPWPASRAPVSCAFITRCCRSSAAAHPTPGRASGPSPPRR